MGGCRDKVRGDGIRNTPQFRRCARIRAVGFWCRSGAVVALANILSLDAPLVAVAWLWLLATALSIRIPEPWWCYGILAAAVWAIYVSDRLFDGMSVGDASTLTARHRFYRARQLPISLSAMGMAAFALWGALHHAPVDLYYYGLVVGFVSVFYLMQCAGARLKNPTINWITVLAATSVLGVVILQLVFMPMWLRVVFLTMVAATGVRLAMEPGGSFFQALPKEVFCGITFAVGVSLPVLVWSELALVGIVLLGGLFSLNCIAIALYEKGHDDANDPIAITKNWPRVRFYYPFLVTGLAALACVLAYFQRDGGTSVFPLAVALGAALLAFLHGLSGKIGSSALRVLADLVLLVPPGAVYLWDTVWG